MYWSSRKHTTSWSQVVNPWASTPNQPQTINCFTNFSTSTESMSEYKSCNEQGGISFLWNPGGGSINRSMWNSMLSMIQQVDAYNHWDPQNGQDWNSCRRVDAHRVGKKCRELGFSSKKQTTWAWENNMRWNSNCWSIGMPNIRSRVLVEIQRLVELSGEYSKRICKIASNSNVGRTRFLNGVKLSVSMRYIFNEKYEKSV